jgi:hypothetical protein
MPLSRWGELDALWREHRLDALWREHRLQDVAEEALTIQTGFSSFDD